MTAPDSPAASAHAGAAPAGPGADPAGPPADPDAAAARPTATPVAHPDVAPPRRCAAPPPLVAHLIYRLAIGGLENGLVNLINHSPRDRVRHAVICLTDADPAFAARLAPGAATVHELHKRPGKDPHCYLRLWRLLRELRPNVLHTRNIGALDGQVVGWLAGTRARVHGLHGWHASDPRGENRRYRTLMRVVDPLIDQYVCVSRDLVRWAHDDIGVAAGRCNQIYNGVDPGRFQGAAGGARERSALPETLLQGCLDPVVIGTVGRLDPIKDQRTLLHAFATLDGQLGDDRLRLVLVGDGPERAALEAAAAAAGIAGRVWFAGARNDVPALLRAFDVFALPSINEGISNTVLEAMASALPVVASRVGGNPELIEDGVSGRLIPAGDARALAATLGEYCRSARLRDDHGRAARRRVEERFSIAAMVERYLAVYEASLAGERRAPAASAATPAVPPRGTP